MLKVSSSATDVVDYVKCVHVNGQATFQSSKTKYKNSGQDISHKNGTYGHTNYHSFTFLCWFVFC